MCVTVFMRVPRFKVNYIFGSKRAAEKKINGIKIFNLLHRNKFSIKIIRKKFHLVWENSQHCSKINNAHAYTEGKKYPDESTTRSAFASLPLPPLSLECLILSFYFSFNCTWPSQSELKFMFNGNSCLINLNDGLNKQTEN